MSSVAIHKSAHDAFNRRDFDTLMGLLSEHHVFVDHGRQIVVDGAEAFLRVAQDEIALASDAAVSEAEYFDAGSAAVCRFLATGTNDGPVGPLPPTNRRYAIPILELCFVDAGRVTRTELFQNVETFSVQLGFSRPTPMPDAYGRWRDRYLEESAPDRAPRT